MQDIKTILLSLGLLESEIATYMAALEHGSSTVIDLSKQTNLSRQAVYVAIDALTKRGLMTSSVVGKKRFYAAEHPNTLLAYAKRKREEMTGQVEKLERLLPELSLAVGGDKPTVKVYEGKEGIKAIIESMRAHTGKELYEITDISAMYTVLAPEDLENMRRELKRRGVTVHGMYAGTGPKQTIVKADRIELGEEDGGFLSHIAVDGDTIQMVTFNGKMISVIVQSKELAQALRTLFVYANHGARKTS